MLMRRKARKDISIDKVVFYSMNKNIMYIFIYQTVLVVNQLGIYPLQSTLSTHPLQLSTIKFDNHNYNIRIFFL